MQKINKFPLKDIIISEDFKSTPPRSEKLARKEEQYKRTGLLPGIVINNPGFFILRNIQIWLYKYKYRCIIAVVNINIIHTINRIHIIQKGGCSCRNYRP